MLVHDCEQGTPEWFRVRAGVITASNFLMIRSKVGLLTEQQKIYVSAVLGGMAEKSAMDLAGYKARPTSATVAKALAGEKIGDWSDAAKNYAFRLACERISGEAIAEDKFETFAMRRGKELEESCRLRHESDIGEIVDLAGFITTDDGLFGASADSLVGVDGGAEYKAFYAPDKVRPILMYDDWGDVADQVQGCIWISDRKWWDQCLYFPALANIGQDFTRRRVTRDPNHTDAMESDLLEFNHLVCEIEAKLRGRTVSEQAATASALADT
jgi:hypothetical protein